MPRKGEISVEFRIQTSQETALVEIALREKLAVDDLVQAAIWQFLARQETRR